MNKLALLPLLAALSAHAFAADNYLSNKVESNAETIKSEDPAAQPLFQRTVRLEEGQSNTTELEVKAGQVYTVFADCSVKCNNISFSITQGRNTLFRRSRGDGSRYTWQAERSGRVELNTEMKSCDSTRCRSVLQVFSGGKLGTRNRADFLAEAQKANREQMLGSDKDSRELPLISGSLAEDEKRSIDLNLTAGKYYTVRANCDTSCEDIDLNLSADGKTVADDTDSDDEPALRFRAEAGKHYRLNIAMEDCDADKCAYSAQIFESGSNTDPSLQQAQQTNVETVRSTDPDAHVFLLRQQRLAAGQSHTEQLNLTAGKVYTFYGDCDNQCSNIDLIVRHNGRIVIQDVLGDSVPLFSYRAPRSGRYSVTLPMKECSSDTCAASIHIFEGSKMVYNR